MTTDIRPEAVKVLTDRDSSAPGSLRHADGRPFTEEELRLYESATPEEFRAAFEQLRRNPAYSAYSGLAAYYEQRSQPDYWEVMEQADARIKELTAPYLEGLPALTLAEQVEMGASLRVGDYRPDLLARMPEQERAEVEALAEMFRPPEAQRQGPND
jgi:hypothetical protein